jgi:hypothetical protein
MPSGKPAGEPCAHLTREYACALFGRPERPGFCSGLQPSREICGTGRAQALALISAMEVATQPSR